jgi:hypothetical protein
MSRPPAPKPSAARRFRQVLAGASALACLMALFFWLLSWRVSTPELHMKIADTIRVVDPTPRPKP